MPKHFDLETVRAVGLELQQLEPDKTTLSAKGAMTILMPEIRAALRRGNHFDDIANTIQRYLPIAYNTIKSHTFGSDRVDVPDEGEGARAGRPRRRGSN